MIELVDFMMQLFLQGVILNMFFGLILNVRKMAKIRNQYNQVPHLTRDTTWESYNFTIRYHKQKPKGQPFSQQVTTRQQ